MCYASVRCVPSRMPAILLSKPLMRLSLLLDGEAFRVCVCGGGGGGGGDDDDDKLLPQTWMYLKKTLRYFPSLVSRGVSHKRQWCPLHFCNPPPLNVNFFWMVLSSSCLPPRPPSSTYLPSPSLFPCFLQAFVYLSRCLLLTLEVIRDPRAAIPER